MFTASVYDVAQCELAKEEKRRFSICGIIGSRALYTIAAQIEMVLRR